MQIPIKIKKLRPNAVIPKHMSAGAAGFDLCAAKEVVIAPEETMLVPTGLAFEIPEGYEMQIRPRSGISAKTKLRIANSPGTIDCDYRGEVCVLLNNINFRCDNIDHYPEFLDGSFIRQDSLFPNGSYIIRAGDRIAQGVLQAVPRAVFEEVEELGETERGSGGFGSSGIK